MSDSGDWESLARDLLTTIAWAMMAPDPHFVLALGVRYDLQEFAETRSPVMSEDHDLARNHRLSFYLRGR